MAKQPKQYIITKTSPYTGRSHESKPLTIEEAVEYYRYTLECGYSWQHEKGNKKINLHPKTIKSLISNLDNAARLVEKLQRQGITVKTETRVHVGPFQSRAEAEEAMTKLKELGLSPLLAPAGAR